MSSNSRVSGDLVNAIFKGGVAEVGQAIAAGADLNALDKYGFPAITEAIIVKRPAIIDLLLTYSIRIDREDYTGKTPLHWAVDRNDYTLVKLLLEKGADPNKYSADGQPLMLNAIMRDNKPLVDLLVQHGGSLDFVNNYINAKLAGHRFELQGQVEVLNTKNKLITIEYEGFYLEFTVGLLRQSLEHFTTGVPKAQVGLFAMQIKKILRALRHGSTLMEHKYAENAESYKDIISDIYRQDLQLIPVSYEGHAITFVKYGNLLAKCDRGVGKIADTIIVYKINNSFGFTEQLIWDLLYKDAPSAKFINIEMKVELRLDPIATLPIKSQLSGNCSWANVESAIPTMLLLLSFPKEYKDKTAITKLKKQVMSFYDTWVAWDKERMFLWAIDKFFAANKVRKISKAQVLCAILVQRCAYAKKNELERAKRILPILTLPRYQFILQSYIKIYCHTKLGKLSKAGRNFSKILGEFGLSFNNLTLTYPLHLAAVVGDLRMIKYLLEEALTKSDVNDKDHTRSTALMYAASKGHLDIVKYLIEQHFADLTIRNSKGVTALDYAKHGKHNSVVQYLRGL